MNDTPPTHFVDDAGDGPPVVFLHSAGLSGRQFRKLASLTVAAGFRALLPDLRGHGRSAPLPEPATMSFHDDVDWLVSLLRDRGPMHVVGHSYGAFVALQAARLAPVSVRSMVLFEPVAFGVLDDDARAGVRAADRSWGDTPETRERWLQGFVDFWGGDGAWAALREDMRAEFRRVGWAVHEGVRTLATDRTGADAYAALTMPITLMTGEHSPAAAGAVVRTLAASWPHAMLYVLADAGHMAPLSHADAVNARVLEALARAQ